MRERGIEAGLERRGLFCMATHTRKYVCLHTQTLNNPNIFLAYMPNIRTHTPALLSSALLPQPTPPSLPPAHAPSYFHPRRFLGKDLACQIKPTAAAAAAARVSGGCEEGGGREEGGDEGAGAQEEAAEERGRRSWWQHCLLVLRGCLSLCVVGGVYMVTRSCSSGGVVVDVGVCVSVSGVVWCSRSGALVVWMVRAFDGACLLSLCIHVSLISGQKFSAIVQQV